MIRTVFELAGGLGLFLLGMVLLTDGLKAWAGEALRGALVRFTGSPAKAFASGALVTALVQSSSATTVAVIGFVSAGLLTLPQAVGVVMGASLGTTGTGWMVSVLGLKVSLGLYALPLVGVGAMMRLLARGRLASLGLAVAGFGLIFLGIDTLQQGMQGLAGVIRLSALPSTSWWGIGLTFGVGVVMTVMLQSSSATMATVLTALHTGSLRFEQAAVLAVGAAVGTTVTGALAALGGNLPARRTALAHIIFNLFTALMALGMLPLYLWAWGWMQEQWGWEEGAISLAAFHTAFIGVGVVVFLPWAGALARGVERWLPDREVVPTRHLDRTVLQVPEVALEAVRGTLRELAGSLLALIRRQMEGGVRAKDAEEAASLRRAVEETEAFLQQIPAVSEAGQGKASSGMLREALWHGLDHVLRLQEHWHAPVSFVGWDGPARRRWGLELSQEVLARAEQGIRGEGGEHWEGELEASAQALAALRREERVEVLRQAAEGVGDAVGGLQRLDAMRWLDRVGYHAWRIAHYLAGSGRPEAGGRQVGNEPVDSAA